MTTAEMFDLIQQRTKVSDKTKILRELTAAYRWVARRVFMSSSGPDLLATYGEELTALADTTREYDLGGNVAGGEFLGLKTLWLRLPSDASFTPMIPSDASEPCFRNADGAPSASPELAIGHPCYYAIVNFSMLRFAPALPAGSILRADYFRLGPAPDLAANPTPRNSYDLPGIFHDAMVTKACALLFHGLDDERENTEETRARDELTDALVVKDKRVQAPVTTAPFRSRRRRWI
jgi:hypothetical protein